MHSVSWKVCVEAAGLGMPTQASILVEALQQIEDYLRLSHQRASSAEFQPRAEGQSVEQKRNHQSKMKGTGNCKGGTKKVQKHSSRAATSPSDSFILWWTEARIKILSLRGLWLCRDARKGDSIWPSELGVQEFKHLMQESLVRTELFQVAEPIQITCVQHDAWTDTSSVIP